MTAKIRDVPTGVDFDAIVTDKAGVGDAAIATGVAADLLGRCCGRVGARVGGRTAPAPRLAGSRASKANSMRIRATGSLTPVPA